MDEAELRIAFDAEMGALEKSGASIVLAFSPRRAWTLLGMLQTFIVLRLADSPDDDVYARELAATIEARLCKTPAIKEMAERGKGSHPPADPPTPLDAVLRGSKPEVKSKRRRSGHGDKTEEEAQTGTDAQQQGDRSAGE